MSLERRFCDVRLHRAILSFEKSEMKAVRDTQSRKLDVVVCGSGIKDLNYGN